MNKTQKDYERSLAFGAAESIYLASGEWPKPRPPFIVWAFRVIAGWLVTMVIVAVALGALAYFARGVA